MRINNTTLIIGCVAFMIPLIFVLMDTDKIEVNMINSYENEYNSCVQKNTQIANQYNTLVETKTVVCETKICSSPIVNYWFIVLGMFLGVVGYGIANSYATVIIEFIKRIFKKKEKN